MPNRKPLAERIQAGFESIPLTPNVPMPPHRPIAPWVRRTNKAARIFAIVVSGATILALTVDAVGSNIWWRTKTDLICTVTSNTHHDTYGKSGYLGTVYDIDTTTCGLLQVTGGGGGLDEQEAETLGRSIQAGTTYEFDVRGWLGWPDQPRAIMSAIEISGRS